MIPKELQFLDLFLDNWFDTSNVRGLYFNLFSTYEDAEDDANPWIYCNYNDRNIEFPRDCGPTRGKGGKWNSINRGGQKNVAYYVEKGGADASAI